MCQPIQISLTPDDGKVVTLHFGGDVMFGRRFFDLNEDGDTTDRILPISGGVEEHLALLEPIQPLLANAVTAWHYGRRELERNG